MARDGRRPKRLERKLAAIGLIFSAFVGPTVTAKPSSGAYVATSKTAMSITGDIDVSSERLTMARGILLPLKMVAKVGRFNTDLGNEPARIFRVTRLMNPVLLNNNRLCTAAVSWIVVWQMPAGGLGMAAFSGAKPHSEDSPGLCGTFYYGAR